MGTYIDENGYKRHSNLVHRKRAYNEIYKKNRDKYPLPFSKYVVHHIDENKLNNAISNLQILTQEEHEAIHFPQITPRLNTGKSSNFDIGDILRVISIMAALLLAGISQSGVVWIIAIIISIVLIKK